MSDGIFLKKCPQEYISTDDKIKVIKLALDQGNNIKGLEILDNIDFTI
mgnify:CR=1 FL=1|jgi:hypothetical protein